MQAEEIEQSILKKFPDAEIEIIDLAGDGDHYKAIITSPHFEGLSRIEQHQSIYNALEGRMGKELHALSLVTRIPK